MHIMLAAIIYISNRCIPAILKEKTLKIDENKYEICNIIY